MLFKYTKNINMYQYHININIYINIKLITNYFMLVIFYIRGYRTVSWSRKKSLQEIKHETKNSPLR